MIIKKMNIPELDKLALSIFFCFLSSTIPSTVQLVMPQNKTALLVNVGVVLNPREGIHWFLNTSLLDFYAAHPDYKTRLVLKIRKYEKDDVVGAAAAALDLIENEQVQVIFGPMSSMETSFIINLGRQAQVPIISLSATSPFLTSVRSPYFFQFAQNDSSQVKAISAVVKAFGWRQVVPICIDNWHGRGFLPFLTDALHEVGTRIPYCSDISSSATDDEILKELYKLMMMQTRVFIVHVTTNLCSRLFIKAKEIGMMSEGYVWLTTSGITNSLNSMDSSVIKSMQGVLGFETYVQKTIELEEFKLRWKLQFQNDYSTIYSAAEVDVFGIWAYDAAVALAMAIEQVIETTISIGSVKENVTSITSIEFDSISHSSYGPKLCKALSTTRFKGLAGEFSLVDGQLQSSNFQVVNVIGDGVRKIGYWTPQIGLVNKLNSPIWPGDSISVPKGWEIPTNGKKLRIGVPDRNGFTELVKVTRIPNTNTTEVSGFTIDVFKAVVDRLPYALPHEFIPFDGTYDDLCHQVYLGIYDVAVGDITITANRSMYVDFTLPYTESAVSMIVPIKDNKNRNAWLFLKPLTWGLWLTCGCFFIFIGFVVWILEHRINEDFEGPLLHQIERSLWFSFSTMVFAQKERVVSNLARFVVIIWCFVVLILTQSYTASLTSLLTVQQIQPTVTDVNLLLKNGENVGYQSGSFIDFTQPYTESGLSMTVPMSDSLLLLKPLAPELWVTCACFFIFIGVVVWILEYRINADFRGHPLGTSFWFSFSTMVFTHRERLVGPLSKFVVIIWCFVVFILFQSYTASLTSLLTVRRLQPTVIDTNTLLKNGDNVGYNPPSFIADKLKAYSTVDELNELFAKGTVNGGIAAAFDEIPYIKLFLATYCSKYKMVEPTFKSEGFAFAFQKDSPLARDFSRAILNVNEGGQMKTIEDNWFKKQAGCPDPSSHNVNNVSSYSLGLESFWGLFFIAGVASTVAVLINTFMFFYEHKDVKVYREMKKMKTLCLY